MKRIRPVDLGVKRVGCSGSAPARYRNFAYKATIPLAEAVATQLATELSARAGASRRVLFDNTLAGDLARLEVRRRLRVEFPELTAEQREAVIVEVLTP
jgi:hypothetical protein